MSPSQIAPQITRPPLPAAEHLLPRDNGGYGVHEVAAVTLGEFRRSVGGTGAAFLWDRAPAGATARRRGVGRPACRSACDQLPGLSQGVITPSSQTTAALMRLPAAWMDLVVRPSQVVGAFDHAVR